MNHSTKQNLLPVRLDPTVGAATPPTRGDVES
jgi:hypothetical protein